MFTVDDEMFDKIVSDAIDNIPEKYGKHIKNLAFVVENEPSEVQRIKFNLNQHKTLFGLYEGVPMTKRGTGYNLVLPDKITLFKKPIEAASYSHESLVQQVKQTLWHEVAHYYGLDHFDINELENKN